MAKQSVEDIKGESQQLRGTIQEELTSPEVTHFGEGSKQLLKFHGIYQQEDRDSRKERKRQSLEPIFFFMVRSKLPGGKLTAEQYLVHDRLADDYANGTIRLTSRQGIQFHGVFKGNLKTHIKSLNDALVSTLAACGDVSRNVMCCPAPIRNNPVRDEMQALADRISDHFCPQTTAYHEIWLNGEKTACIKQGDDVEPIYGKNYLPRKFKFAIALPDDNCIDVLANDCGLVAIQKDGKIEGYNVFAGGGMGTTHGMAKTYPRLATPVCFATPDEVLDVVTAIVKVQRDYGNREDRRQARLKYTIDHMGQDKFKELVAQYYGKPLTPYTGQSVVGFEDHLGWHPQGDGKWWLGIHVLAGRIADTDKVQYKTGLRKAVEKFSPTVRLLANQSIMLCDLDPSVKPELDKLLADHGITPADEISKIYRLAMACPAVPTCALALTDSERALDSILQGIQAEIVQLGLGGEEIVLHMTGCPNGCARPYNSDIGIVGRSVGKYTLYLGGNVLGSAINFEFKDMVPQEQLAAELRGPLMCYKEQRQDGERFGDFCQRVGKEALLAFSENVTA